jgi:hypothetical protein
LLKKQMDRHGTGFRHSFNPVKAEPKDTWNQLLWLWLQVLPGVFSAPAFSVWLSLQLEASLKTYKIEFYNAFGRRSLRSVLSGTLSNCFQPLLWVSENKVKSSWPFDLGSCWCFQHLFETGWSLCQFLTFHQPRWTQPCKHLNSNIS